MELFTIREVAEKLKISISSMYRYVENGSFPHIKLGTNIRFTHEQISDFLAKKQEKFKPEKVCISSPCDLQAIYDQF